jgi:anaerobic selenocysteine-containing dehydrogenase
VFARSPVESETEADEYRLIGRRMMHTYNSSGTHIEKLTKQYSYNPAFMHPDDLAALKLFPGDVVKIDSGHASIFGIVEQDETLRRGLLSMSHGWGDSSQHDENFRHIGSNTARLNNCEGNFDRHSGIPIMSNVSVRVTPAHHSADSRGLR